MYGPPLTFNEIAATVTRQVTALRELGASIDRAVEVVAERHRIPASSVTQLVAQHRRRERGQAQPNQAAA